MTYIIPFREESEDQVHSLQGFYLCTKISKWGGERRLVGCHFIHRREQKETGQRWSPVHLGPNKYKA